MKFKTYIKKIYESNPEKRAVGTYGSLFPIAYGLTYRMQYNPESLKKLKKVKMRKK